MDYLASMVEAYIVSIIASLIVFSTVFVWAKLRNRYDIIDSAWGVAFIVIALNTFVVGGYSWSYASVQLLLLALVAVWGFRLALHIYQRWQRSPREDHRYAELRERYSQKFGSVALNMFVRVYLVQALLAVVVSAPVIVAMSTDYAPFVLVTWVGLAVWVVGFFFEAVGDWQLRTFMADPSNKGKLMTSGVWKYTRHPNYFGELAQWWGIFLIAVVAAPELWWVAIVGPLVISHLLLFVSGVPLTEKHFEGRSGWSEYKRRTSKLIPLPPKSTD